MKEDKLYTVDSNLQPRMQADVYVLAKNKKEATARLQKELHCSPDDLLGADADFKQDASAMLRSVHESDDIYHEITLSIVVANNGFAFIPESLWTSPQWENAFKGKFYSDYEVKTVETQVALKEKGANYDELKSKIQKLAKHLEKDEVTVLV
jgi:hypothetical protein